MLLVYLTLAKNIKLLLTKTYYFVKNKMSNFCKKKSTPMQPMTEEVALAEQGELRDPETSGHGLPRLMRSD
jgi:hypothetical protein